MTGTIPSGARILVVEDESIVVMLIEDTLGDIGCEVAGVASRLDQAMQMAGTLDFDAALLDLNLNGQRTLPVAEALQLRGIPFVFTTGYGVAGVPEELRAHPILSKPFTQRDLEQALATALGTSAAS